MNIFEFFYFSFYLCFLTAMIVAIQMYEDAHIRIQKEVPQEYEVVEEKWADSDEEEETKEAFDPEKETYTMTENPMLRHRTNVAETVEAN